MYWSEYGFLERAQLDGDKRSKVALLIDAKYGYAYSARGLALDKETNRIYFVSYSKLLYVDLDSNGNGTVQELYSSSYYLANPRAVAVDDQFVYWNDYWREKVFRINKTTYGRLQPDAIATGLFSPRGIVVKSGDPKPIRKYISIPLLNFSKCSICLVVVSARC